MSRKLGLSLLLLMLGLVSLDAVWEPQPDAGEARQTSNDGLPWPR